MFAARCVVAIVVVHQFRDKRLEIKDPPHHHFAQTDRKRDLEGSLVPIHEILDLEVHHIIPMNFRNENRVRKLENSWCKV